MSLKIGPGIPLHRVLGVVYYRSLSRTMFAAAGGTPPTDRYRDLPGSLDTLECAWYTYLCRQRHGLARKRRPDQHEMGSAGFA